MPVVAMIVNKTTVSSQPIYSLEQCAFVSLIIITQMVWLTLWISSNKYNSVLTQAASMFMLFPINICIKMVLKQVHYSPLERLGGLIIVLSNVVVFLKNY